MSAKIEKLENVLTKNWMIIEIDYTNKIVLPLKKGTELLNTLEIAYSYQSDYQKEELIKPVDIKIATRIISDEQFKEYRRNYILGVNDVETDSND